MGGGLQRCMPNHRVGHPQSCTAGSGGADVTKSAPAPGYYGKVISSDEMLRVMLTTMLLKLACNLLEGSPKTPTTVEDAIDALALQARLSISLIAALVGRGSIAAGGKSPDARTEPHKCTPAARRERRKT